HAAKLLFQVGDPGAYGRLRDIELLGGADEISGGNYRQKGTCKFGIHGAAYLYRYCRYHGLFLFVIQILSPAISFCRQVPPPTGLLAMGTKNPLHTPICDLLHCDYPILQAGMGGVARAELVAAVVQAGGYGFLGMVRETPELIAGEIKAVRARTNGMFGVNLIPSATDPALFEAELAVCLEHHVHSLCFFWDVRSE